MIGVFLDHLRSYLNHLLGMGCNQPERAKKKHLRQRSNHEAAPSYADP